MAYFKQSNIKIKIEHVDGQPGMDLSDDDEVPAKDDSREKDGKRQIKKKKIDQNEMQAEYDSSEDDDDFTEGE